MTVGCDIKKIIEEREIKRNISIKDTEAIAAKLGEDIRDVEEMLLNNKIIPYKYMRNFKVFSVEEQLKLLNSRVAIIGCGGLGGYVIEELSRAGVGHITIIDDDVFEENNLNRQIGSSYDTLKKTKVEVLKDRVSNINPSIRITAIKERLNQENATGFLMGHDIVVDALDNIESRRAAQICCENLSMPFVHGAIGGWYFQITTIFPGDKTLEKLYKENQGGGIERSLGNPSFTPALAASFESAEVIKFLIGRGETLRNKVLFGDLYNMEFSIIDMI